MKDRFNPRAIEIVAFCRSGVTLEGEWPQSGMSRLADGPVGVDVTPPPVVWSARGEVRRSAGADDAWWLHLTASTAVTRICQRCLQPMSQPLQVDRDLRFVRDESEAARLDEESDDDVLAMRPRTDLHELVEDELILALPIVPRHDHCPVPLPVPDDVASDADGDRAEPAAPHPFAALAALRGKGGGGGEEGGSGGEGGNGDGSGRSNGSNGSNGEGKGS